MLKPSQFKFTEPSEGSYNNFVYNQNEIKKNPKFKVKEMNTVTRKQLKSRNKGLNIDPQQYQYISKSTTNNDFYKSTNTQGLQTTGFSSPTFQQFSSLSNKKQMYQKKIQKLQKKEKNEIVLQEEQQNRLFQLMKKEKSQQQKKPVNCDLQQFYATEKHAPKMIMEVFKDEGPEVRNKIRDFLGSRNRSELFDNLDDFSNCLKMLNNQARLISTQMTRTLMHSGTEKKLNLEELEIKFAKKTQDVSLFKPEDLEKLYQRRLIPPKDQVSPRFKPEKQFQSAFAEGNDSKLETSMNNQYTQKSEKKIEKRDILEQNDQKSKLKFSQQSQEFDKLRSKLQNYQKDFKSTLKNLNSVRMMKGNSQFLTPVQHQNQMELSKSQEQKNITQQLDNIEAPYIQKKREDEQKKQAEEHQKQLFKRFRQTIQHLQLKFKKLGITYDEVIRNKVFRKLPLERQNSQEFLFEVKQGNTEQVIHMLRHCKYHVYDFDHTNQTPLHWAVRRNFVEITNALLDNGANLEASDIGGRTPLYLAVKMENKMIINVLLARGASPFTRSLTKMKPLDLIKDKNRYIEQLLMKAEKLHYSMNLLPYKKHLSFWYKYAIPIFTTGTSSTQISTQGQSINSKLFSLKSNEIQI